VTGTAGAVIASSVADDLRGRHALVTGAARGVGRATALPRTTTPPSAWPTNSTGPPVTTASSGPT
jgi:hypothetical protein